MDNSQREVSMNLRSEVLILAKKLCLYKIFPLLSETAKRLAAGQFDIVGEAG